MNNELLKLISNIITDNDDKDIFSNDKYLDLHKTKHKKSLYDMSVSELKNKTGGILDYSSDVQNKVQDVQPTSGKNISIWMMILINTIIVLIISSLIYIFN